MALVFKGFACAIDVLKLRIAIRMRGAFDGFFVDMQRKAKIMQDLCQCGFADSVPFGLQSPHEMGQRLARPLHEAHRVSFRLQFLLQIP